MFLFGFPLIIGALVYTLIRLCFVYRKNLRKGLLIFLSYILGPLLIGLLGLCVVMIFQIHQFVFIVLILMILVSYLPPLYLYHFERDQ
ncbi:glycosyltransferase [Streptococcus sp. bf_0095]|nr:glycosyltransferase [Streptococcus sp. bf_0095]